jgi:amidase
MSWGSGTAPVMDEILRLDATAQLHALATKQVGAAELLEALVGRYQAVNPRLNAVVATDLERARARARAVDDQRVAGEPPGFLAGLPMTIKDTLDVEAMPALAGLRAFLNRSPKDAAAVARARAQGAVIWGKTNVPVMAGDWQSFNGVYGTTNNPWDLARTSGGSSGGAAAVLASGVTALEIGSDIGGSLRVPASFCGVFSHKPTWGLISQRGHLPPRPGSVVERDLNVIGPLARSARDLRLLLSVITEGAVAAKDASAKLNGLRVGLWLDEPAFALDPEVRMVIEGFARKLAGLGAAVEMIRPVDGPALLAAYQMLLAPLIAEDLAQASSPSSAEAPAEPSRTPQAGWLAADEARGRFGHQLRGVFDHHDVLIAPVAAVAGFPHDHAPFASRRLRLSDGRLIAYHSMLNWIAMATACGLPATTFPAGQTVVGLPVGVQIIGPHGADGRVLSVAQAIENEMGGFTPPPELAGWM